MVMTEQILHNTYYLINTDALKHCILLIPSKATYSIKSCLFYQKKKKKAHPPITFIVFHLLYNIYSAIAFIVQYSFCHCIYCIVFILSVHLLYNIHSVIAFIVFHLLYNMI